MLTAALYALVRASLGIGDEYRKLMLGAQALCDGLPLGSCASRRARSCRAPCSRWRAWASGSARSR